MIVIPVIYILWLLSDTITEYLSNGKSFAPKETQFNYFNK